jgi:DNA-binding transcriptional ArsR family regulator
MVEYRELDAVFRSLADPTRRDILKRISRRELSVSEVAAAYARQLSLAAVSKHIGVLERAHLIHKRRKGREHYIAASPPGLTIALHYLKQLEKVWEARLDRLAAHIEESATWKKK